MADYNGILFDLDHTLWDYHTNSRETLHDMYVDFGLANRLQADFDAFHDVFQDINATLWNQYDRGLIQRDAIRRDRFNTILGHFSVTDTALSRDLSEAYVREGPKKGNLIKGALDILEYLHPRYPMFIVTNGFEEVQFTKVKSAGLEKYFREIVISDRVGHKKPSPEIFHYVVDTHGIPHRNLIMIGDNMLTDIAGAVRAGIDSVLFNPPAVLELDHLRSTSVPPGTEGVQPTHTIAHLQELKGIL